jgi:hypothetical protein
MTNQDFVDWAFDQVFPAEQKLTLLAFAMAAGPDGGGKISLATLAHRAGCDLASALGHTFRLQGAGLIIIHYAPAPGDVSAGLDEISFGLCIDKAAKPT